MAHAKELEDALQTASMYAVKGKTGAEMHKIVDEIWKKVAEFHHCDVNSIRPTNPPNPNAFMAIPLPGSRKVR